MQFARVLSFFLTGIKKIVEEKIIKLATHTVHTNRNMAACGEKINARFVKRLRLIFRLWRIASVMNLNVSTSIFPQVGSVVIFRRFYVEFTKIRELAYTSLVKALALKPLIRKLAGSVKNFVLREHANAESASSREKPLISLMMRLNTPFFRRIFLRLGRNLPLILANPEPGMFIKLAIPFARIGGERGGGQRVHYDRSITSVRDSLSACFFRTKYIEYLADL